MKISTFFKIGVVVGAVYTIVKALEAANKTAPEDSINPTEREFDIVEEAMLESFPASDPTSYR